VFQNRGGTFSEITEKLGLAKYKGWWNGVTTGDFDGDGRLDIVASNWGQNTPYESHRTTEHPLRLYYGDANGDGVEDVIEAFYDASLKEFVPERMLSFVSRGLPSIRERYPSYESFARASLEEICGPGWRAMKFMEANWLESTVFLNRGDHFEARALPAEAQFAPAFAVCVGDFDGDGREDIFLSQNFFATQADTPRYDGGVGLFLRGDGRGGFTAVPPGESGIKVYGEQRGAALCDFDHDGRVDLAVTQNGAETKLFRNQNGKSGLRVKLIGPPENRDGIGATLWMTANGTNGPAREIHSGSGYWSHDSLVQVLAAGGAELHVRWLGGKVTVTRIPPGAKEMTVDSSGNAQVSP